MWVNYMRKMNLKANKGVSTVDVVVAIIILSLFVGVIGNLYYQVAKNSSMIRYNTVAVYYAIKIAEDIDEMAYEEVNDNLTEKYQLPEGFTATLNIEKYNKNDSTKQDVIKKVNITINYTFLNETQKYTIRKLKIKEM